MSAGTEIADETPSPVVFIGLTRPQWKNLSLAQLGSILEIYEYQVFGFFAVIIGELFFSPSTPPWVRDVQTWAIFSVGTFVRPLSGAIIGHFGDRYGRKKLFIFTVLLMALPTLAIGFLPTYAIIGIFAPILLLCMRIFQGFSAAAEVAGAGVFVTEHVPGSRIGFASGFLYGGNYTGYLLGSGIGALVVGTMSPSMVHTIGWRLPFIVGGLFGILAFWLRRNLDETPLFREIRVRREESKAPFSELLQSYRIPMLYVITLLCYLGCIIGVIYFYLPAFLVRVYNIPQSTMLNTTTLGFVVLVLTCPIWGWIADRIGLGRVIAFGAIGIALVTIAMFFDFPYVVAHPDTLKWWFMAESAMIGTFGLIPALSALTFPTQVRFTGFGLCYNLGLMILGGPTPAIVALLAHAYGTNAIMWYVVVACTSGVIIGASTSRMRFYPKEG